MNKQSNTNPTANTPASSPRKSKGTKALVPHIQSVGYHAGWKWMGMHKVNVENTENRGWFMEMIHQGTDEATLAEIKNIEIENPDAMIPVEDVSANTLSVLLYQPQFTCMTIVRETKTRRVRDSVTGEWKDVSTDHLKYKEVKIELTENQKKAIAKRLVTETYQQNPNFNVQQVAFSWATTAWEKACEILGTNVLEEIREQAQKAKAAA